MSTSEVSSGKYLLTMFQIVSFLLAKQENITVRTRLGFFFHLAFFSFETVSISDI